MDGTHIAVNSPSNCLPSNQSSPDTAKDTATASMMKKSDSLNILISLLIELTLVQLKARFSPHSIRWNPTAASNSPAIVTAAGMRTPTIPKTSIIDGMKLVNPSGTHTKNGVATTTPTQPAILKGERLCCSSLDSDACLSSFTVTVLISILFWHNQPYTHNTSFR